MGNATRLERGRRRRRGLAAIYWRERDKLISKENVVIFMSCLGA